MLQIGLEDMAQIIVINLFIGLALVAWTKDGLLDLVVSIGPGMAFS